MKIIQGKPFGSEDESTTNFRKSRKQISNWQLNKALKLFVTHLDEEVPEEECRSLLSWLMPKLHIYMEAQVKAEIMSAL